MSDTYTAATEAVQQYTETVREDLDAYTGLAIGTGLQAAQWITDRPLFEDHLNPWSADKGAHGAFCYGLTGGTYRAAEKVADLTEDTAVERYTENLRDPRYQAGLAFGVVGAFTGIKEFLMDQDPDGFDMAANYIGYSTYILKDHHGIDSWTEEGKELGQQLYDSIRTDGR